MSDIHCDRTLKLSNYQNTYPESLPPFDIADSNFFSQSVNHTTDNSLALIRMISFLIVALLLSSYLHLIAPSHSQTGQDTVHGPKSR